MPSMWLKQQGHYVFYYPPKVIMNQLMKKACFDKQIKK